MRRITFLAAGLVLLAVPSSAQSRKTAPQYVVVQLGSFGGTVGRSNAVNDRGWVSGWSNLAADALSARAVRTGGLDI